MKRQSKPFVVEVKRRNRLKPAEPKSIWADTPGLDRNAFRQMGEMLHEGAETAALERPAKVDRDDTAAREPRILPIRPADPPGSEQTARRKPAAERPRRAPASEITVSSKALDTPQDTAVPQAQPTKALASINAAGASSKGAPSEPSSPSRRDAEIRKSYHARRRDATGGLPLGQRWKRLLPEHAR